MTLCIEEKNREGTPKAEKEHLQVLGKNMGEGEVKGQISQLLVTMPPPHLTIAVQIELSDTIDCVCVCRGVWHRKVTFLLLGRHLSAAAAAAEANDRYD